MSDEPQRPTGDNRDEWKAYWTALGTPWRTEPEIDKDRQGFLAKRKTVEPDIEYGIYPFRDEIGSIKLDRADVEWLLATHHDGQWLAEWDRTKPGMRREGIDLRGADLRGVDLRRLPLMQLLAGLDAEDWGARSSKQKDESGIHLEGANLHYAYLQDASLRGAHLEGADLQSAHLEGAMLRGAWLGAHKREGMDNATHSREPNSTILRFAHLDADTNMPEVNLGDLKRGFVRLADTHWNNTDVTRVPWPRLVMTGDEQVARHPGVKGKRKRRKQRLDEYLIAVRGYRQLVALTRSQGLVEDGDRFAYRAQVLQRQVLKRQGHLGGAFASWLLDLISGYGYRPLRSLYTYLLTISIFALLFWCITNNVSLTFGWFTHIITWLGMSPPPASTEHLQGYEAVVVSMTSFHGRGFFQPVQSPGDKVAILAAVEAFFGLLLEIVLIATFTQRFFAR
jgi:hypothetical protein